MILAVIYVLVLVAFILVIFSVMQIRMAGMNIKDFWGFIKANQVLDDLYLFSKKERAFSPQEQIIFLTEAEKVFNAFDKVPNMLWDEEYQKYREVLNKYKDIKMVRWVSN